jgi:hypothetical protein
MRVLLAGPDFEENLSIRYLASSLQTKRHETSLAVFNSADDVEAVAEQAGEVEIVGLSVCFQSRAYDRGGVPPIQAASHRHTPSPGTAKATTATRHFATRHFPPRRNPDAY